MERLFVLILGLAAGLLMLAAAVFNLDWVFKAVRSRLFQTLPRTALRILYGAIGAMICVGVVAGYTRFSF